MISGPVSCAHYPSGPRMPSSYALARPFSSLEFIFPFPILRANFLCRRTSVHLYCRNVCSHLFCHSVFITLPIHPFNQSLYPFIHSPTHPSVQLHSHSPTQASRFVSFHLPILPLLSHSLLQTTYLSICPFIHLSSLTHPPIYSLIHPPTHPIYPCI